MAQAVEKLNTLMSLHNRQPQKVHQDRYRSANATLPSILIAYILVYLLPIELSFYIGSLFMTPTRVFFLITTIPLIVIFFNREKPMIIDWLLAAYVMWVVLAYLVKRGGGGVEAAGQSFLQLTAPYLLARIFFKDSAQVARYVIVMCISITVLGLLAIPESLFYVRYLHTIPQMLTGISYEMQSDVRLGLLRAASTFENPILFGLYCATFFSLLWYSTSSVGTRTVLTLGVLVATGLSLSSAPMLLILVQFFLIVAERASRKIKSRVPLILVAVSASVIFIETFSNRGVAKLIASNLTFNPSTGYYRLLQWEHSIDDVRSNPLFGINFENWTRPFWMTDSVDNNWLFLAMDSGIPAVALICSLLLSLSYKIYRRRKTVRDPILKSLMLGWIICISALFLGAWTVTLFGKMLPAQFFLIGLGAALLQIEDTGVPGPINQGTASYSRNNRYSRFAPTKNRNNSHTKVLSAPQFGRFEN